jgi:hypothetical protein
MGLFLVIDLAPVMVAILQIDRQTGQVFGIVEEKI